jgi:hypothetical protein
MLDTSLRPPRTVSAEEATEVQTGAWMRQAVRTHRSNLHCYGQVTAYRFKDDSVTVTCGHEMFDTPASELSEVAPVVAMLLWNLVIPTSSYSDKEMAQWNDDILSRICGETPGDQQASCDIPTILDGLVEIEDMPRGDEVIQWCDPTDGVTKTTSIQHVVDFAHHNREGATAGSTDLLGETFCSDPLFSDITSPPSDTLGDQHPETQPKVAPRQLLRKRRATPSDFLAPMQSATSNQPARPGAPHRDQPSDALGTDLLYPYGRTPSGRPFLPSSATHLQWWGQKPTPSPSDFNPGYIPRLVHQHTCSTLTATDPPVVVVHGIATSPTLGIVPHPAVVQRLYEFKFQPTGLSVMHMTRVSFLERTRWEDANCDDTTDVHTRHTRLPKAKKAKSVSDIVQALENLHRYTHQFCNEPTSSFVTAAIHCAQAMDTYRLFHEEEMDLVTRWFDDGFQQYYCDVVSDALSRDSPRPMRRLDTWKRFDPNSNELRHLDVLISDRVLNRAHSTIPVPTTHKRQRTDEGPKGEPKSSIPDEVVKALPAKNGLPMCMRYLSQKGCQPDRPGTCASGDRSHFKPTSLPKVVNQFICDRMGGLKREFSSI